MESQKKPIRHIRAAFDTESRQISRARAARLLWTNRRHMRRIKAGYKFMQWFEPAIISASPILHPVNF